MTDTRFTTICDGVEELLAAVDVDEVGDIETLLMFLFARPITLTEAWVEDGRESFEVTVHGSDGGGHLGIDFPMSVVDLVRSCAENVPEVGRDAGNDVSEIEPPNVSGMGEAELITELQQSLGKVRIFNMMNAAD